MASQVANSKDLLSQFSLWGRQNRESLLVPYVSEDLAIPIGLEGDVGQDVIFRNDLKHKIHDVSTHVKYEVASLAQCIAMLVLSPFAMFGEFYRLCRGSINASTCLAYICVVPIHIVSSILKAALCVVTAMNKLVSAMSNGIGFLAWHGGERLVRWIADSPHTVLSNRLNIRDIVYQAVGITLFAAVAVFIPVAPIQMVALPIILGSFYGTMNNQFTVRDCPEYYTMGHYYDGTSLKGHAIKTNNVLIKPIVTGCYATTMVTKLAGIVLTAVGRIPYTAAVLPVATAGAMIAGVCVISLVVAHIFSTMARKSIQKNLDAYAKLVGVEWGDVNRNKTWNELKEMREELIERRRRECAANVQELEKFNRQLLKLTENIESNIRHPDLPVKYIAGWQANHTRNGIGYLFAGGGTLAVAVSTIFLRIFVF